MPRRLMNYDAVKIFLVKVADAAGASLQKSLEQAGKNMGAV